METTEVQEGKSEAAAFPALAATALSLVALSACNGGPDETDAVTGTDGIGRAIAGERRMRQILEATGEAGCSLRVPDATALLDWAERQYAPYFPGPQANLTSGPWVYRYYAATANYLGVNGSEVYVLGPVSDGQLLKAGTLRDFGSFVYSGCLAAKDVDAVRFLQQAQFAATDEDIAAVLSIGYEGWLNRQFTMPPGLSGGGWLDANGYDTVDAETRYFLQASLGDQMAWAQLLARPDTLRVRIALALSEYFVMSITGIDNVGAWVVNYGAAGYWDLLCQHAFGNFRGLLEAVTLSYPMGAYLGTRDNLKEDPATGRLPDENYAREVMQLFTIGLYVLNADGTARLDAAGHRIETYSQDDVTGLARVFTGYSGDGTDYKPIPVSTEFSPNGLLDDTMLCRRPMALKSWNHSTLATSFLTASIPANTDAAVALKIALDTLFAHPNVGPFFGRQMIQRLVTSHPSAAYVGRVAAAFNNNGRGVRGDLRAVFTAILLDPEARDAELAARDGFGKVREPMVRFVQWAHTFADGPLRARVQMGDTSTATALGQSPLRAPSVFNFFRPGYIPPGTEMARAGAAAPEFQIVNETTVASYLNFMLPYVRSGFTVQDRVRDASGRFVSLPRETVPVPYTKELALAATPEALVSRLNLLLAAGRLSTETVKLVADAVRAINVPTGNSTRVRERVAAAVLLVMASPEYLVQK